MLPPSSNIRYVDRNEAIGQRLIEIRQLWSMCPGEGFDYAWSYRLLDSGLIIALRYECIVVDELPLNAEPIVHRSLDHIYGQLIESAWLAPEDCEWVDERIPYLMFRNGWAISDAAVAPHGLGAVGVSFFEPGELDFTKFQSLW